MKFISNALKHGLRDFEFEALPERQQSVCCKVRVTTFFMTAGKTPPT
jgi:hypothetical protein